MTEFGIALAKDVLVPMRDGILLATDVYQPARDGELVDGRFPTIVCITPYDKTAMTAIERSLRDSDLGVNPTNDGNLIRVSLPELTEERRKEYIKLARHKGEDARVTVRSIRRKAMDELHRIVRDGDAGEDEVARAEKELQGTTDKYVHQVDDLVKHKEAELLEV